MVHRWKARTLWTGAAFLVLVSLLAVLPFAACGCGAAAGVGAVTSNIVSGFAVKGRISNGEIELFELLPDGSKGQLIADGTTDNSGAFQVEMPDFQGPVWLEIGSGTYIDEGTGYQREISPGFPVAAILPNYGGGSVSNMSVTPLTTIATGLARGRMARGVEPEDAAASANSQVGQYFGVLDILYTPSPDLLTGGDAGASHEANNAACVISGLCTLAANRDVEPMALCDALANDVYDENFDGVGDEGAIDVGGVPLGADATAGELADSMEQFLDSDLNQSNLNSDNMGDQIDQVGGNTGELKSPWIDILQGVGGAIPEGWVAAESYNVQDGAKIYFGGVLTEWYRGEEMTDILTVKVPDRPAGTGKVDVTVVNPDGTRVTVKDAYDYGWTGFPTPPAPPSLISPASAATSVPWPPLFEWESCTEAYPAPLNTLYVYDSGMSLVESHSTYYDYFQGTGTYTQGNSYTWYVRSENSEDYAESGSWGFTAGSPAGAEPPGLPTLSSPGNGATDVPYLSGSLIWLPPSSGTPPFTYDVQVATDSGFSGLVVDTSTSSANYSPTLSQSTPYWWRIGANNSYGSSGWTTSRSFTTGADGGGGGLGWAHRWGASGYDEGSEVAVDSSGNVYVCGSFEGTVDFDPGPGTVEHSAEGASDVFVSRFDSSGTLQWSTYLGGPGTDYGSGLCVGSDGNVYVTGAVSDDAGGVYFDPPGADVNVATRGGGGGSFDAFVWCLNSSGTHQWGHVLGGNGSDTGKGVGYYGSMDRVWVIGDFDSSDAVFNPSSPGTTQGTEGSLDVFLWSATGSTGTYQYSSYLGGSSNDEARDIAVDSSGNLYICGSTASSDAHFCPADGDPPVAAQGERDAFVAGYNNGGNLIWSTYLGGSSASTSAWTCGVDGSYCYVGGDFSGTVDFGGGNVAANADSDAFVSRLNISNGAYGGWTWTVGGSGAGNSYNSCESLAVGDSYIYATGNFFGSTVDFNPNGSANYSSSNGESDIFLVSLVPGTGALDYIETCGGPYYDWGTGAAWFAGSTYTTGIFEGDVYFHPPTGSLLQTTGEYDADGFLRRTDD